VKLVIDLLATVRRPVIPDFVRICCSRPRTDRGHLFAFPDTLAVNHARVVQLPVDTDSAATRTLLPMAVIIVAKRSKLFDSVLFYCR
jgi:hypothetical protein